MTHESIWVDLQGVPFEQGYVDAGGIRTRYLMTGAEHKDVLVFLHGFGGHAEAYTRNLAEHGKHFRTYSIDMVGHGYTDKPDYPYDIPAYTRHLADFLDAIGAPAARLSGESLGGWVAASFALAFPDRVERLALNTMGGATMNLEVMKTVREKTLAAARAPRESTRGRLEWLMADPSRVHDDLVECRTRIYEQAGAVQAVENGTVLYLEDVRAKYLMDEARVSGIRAPTIVIWTTKDPTAAPEVGERIAAAIPEGEYALITDCGHWPQFEDAQAFNRIHLEFMLR
ncbi:MAG: alpha/beta hydrolase [Halioglobus sp.]